MTAVPVVNLVGVLGELDPVFGQAKPERLVFLFSRPRSRLTGLLSLLAEFVAVAHVEVLRERPSDYARTLTRCQASPRPAIGTAGRAHSQVEPDLKATGRLFGSRAILLRLHRRHERIVEVRSHHLKVTGAYGEVSCMIPDVIGEMRPIAC
jgi:hypothetical protein